MGNAQVQFPRSKGASKVGSHKRTYAEVSASMPSTSNAPSRKKISNAIQPTIPPTATKSSKRDSKDGNTKSSYAKVLVTTNEVPSIPKKNSSEGDPSNPPSVEETTTTQQDTSSAPLAINANQCKVCHWEGKSLMAH